MAGMWRRADDQWTDEEREARLAQSDWIAERQAQVEEFDTALRELREALLSPIRRLLDWIMRSLA